MNARRVIREARTRQKKIEARTCDPFGLIALAGNA